MTDTNFIPVVVNSTGKVRFADGVVRGIGQAQRSMAALQTDVEFEGCHFEPATANINSIFDKTKPGRAIGRTNNWNMFVDSTLEDDAVRYFCRYLVGSGVTSVDLSDLAKWEGNRILLRSDGGTFSVTSQSGTIKWANVG